MGIFHKNQNGNSKNKLPFLIPKNDKESSMKSWKKRIAFMFAIATIVFLILGLSSCKRKHNDQGSNNGNTSTDDDIIYSAKVDAVLVLGDGVSEASLSRIKSAYLNQTGKSIKVARTDSEESAHEIVCGKTSREISRKAYRLLTVMEKESDEQVGYVIYSDGKSVAIAFDEAKYGVHSALIEAIEIFAANYMTSSSLKCGSGTLQKNSFDPIEWQNARDEESIDLFWKLKSEQVLSKVGGDETLAVDILKALKTFYELYNKDHSTVRWLANLYDPVSGGFYYSNSARNNEGYLPDLESTADAIALIKAVLSGYSGSLSDYFGEEISKKFVSFVRDMQNEVNGYFYHPQWTKEAVDKNLQRKGRDLDNALYILSYFGALPRYDTPNGIKGESTAPVSKNLTLPLSLSTVTAVSIMSELKEEDEIYIPAHLLTKESFEGYLSSLSLSSNPCGVAEQLDLLGYQIAAREAQLEEQGENWSISAVLTSYLERYQNSKGLWGASSIDNSEKLRAVYKIASLYTKIGKIIPKSNVIVETISAIITEESSVAIDISEISEFWTALAAVLNNVNKYENGTVNRTVTLFYSKLSELITATHTKLINLIKDDGSFSTVSENDSGTRWGLPVSPANKDEGNVNATLTAIKTVYLSVFDSMGIGSVPIFNSADRMLFQKTLSEMGVIIKNEIVESAPIDFESENIGNTTTEAVFESSDATSAVITDGGEERGNVLNIKSISASTYDMVEFPVRNTVVGASCNIADFDMCILEGTENGVVLQIGLQSDMYMLTVNVKDGVVMIHEDSSRTESLTKRHDLGIRANVGEWFNLRIEHYVGNRDTVRMKVFFNGECIAVTDNFYGNYSATSEPKTNYQRLRFRAMAGTDLNMLLDDIVSEQNYKVYFPETDSNGKLVRNIDAPDDDKKVYTFESSSQGTLPSGFISKGTAGTASVVDNNGDNCLSLSSGAKIVLPLDERGSRSNSAVLEFDATVHKDSPVGSVFAVNFNEYLYNGRNLTGFRLTVIKENGTKYLTVLDSLNDKPGTEYSSVRLPLDEEFVFRAHYFFNEGVAVLMINNSIVGISSNVFKDAYRCFMGEVTVSVSGDSAQLLTDNLTCERIPASYDTITAPTVDKEIHSFDSLEGLDSSGVAIINGMISFENAKVGSYVKIPVNQRASVAILGIVDMLVEKVLGDTSDLIVSLTDASGNKIAAFALRQTESGVDIHEYTENGVYPKALCSVEAASFNLGIEYNITKGDFNLLADGKHVASTSVTYSMTSSAFAFNFVEISANEQTGFRIDDLSAETVAGIFIIPTYDEPNADNSDELVTYEHSSFASLPKLFTTAYLKTPEAKLTIRESVLRTKATKVLEFYTGTSDTDVLLIERLTKKLDGANAVAFETDLMLSPESGSMEFEITLKPRDRSACSVYVVSKDGKLKITSSNLKTRDTYLDIENGEWFNIRIEYADTPYDFDYNEVNDVIIKVYINGELVADGIRSNYPSSSPAASTVNQVRFGVGSGMAGKVFFDNTVYEQFDLAYEAPVPPDTHTLTFEPGVINKKVKSSLGAGSSLSVIDMTVAERVNKVLRLATAESASDKLDISVTQPYEGANAICFETDIMISPTSDTLALTLEPLNNKGRQPFSLNITAEKGGYVKLSAKGIDETVIGRSGEWIHLRIEYMNPVLDYDGDGERDILVKVYIGYADVPVAICYSPYNTTSHYDPAKLDTFRLSVGAGSAADVFLDNVKYWQIELVPDEGGVPPIEKEDEPLGDSDTRLDEDGWA